MTTPSSSESPITAADAVSVSRSATLTPPDGDGDIFGSSLAVSNDGETAIVGDRLQSNPDASKGSVFVFVRESGEWRVQAELRHEADDDRTNFGQAAAISDSGTTAVVGAWSHARDAGEFAGSAYIYASDGGEWTQQATLAPDVYYRAGFGIDVAIAGDGSTIFVGAENDADEKGAVYVYTQQSGEWRRQTRLTADDGESDDQFGGCVSASADGTTVLVGDRAADDSGDRAGVAYVFEKDGDGWRQQATFHAEDAGAGDEFGDSTALSANGSVAILGASEDTDPNGKNAGSAYVFADHGSQWRQVEKLTPDSGGDEGDFFGGTVAVSNAGNVALIGAQFDEQTTEASGESTGAAYLFARRPDGWAQQDRLTGKRDSYVEDFAQSVGVSGDGQTVIVTESGGSGKAHVWTQ